jgi:anti-anti-sigma regulatory factor
MNHELHLAPTFGSFLAEGARAAEFRLREIEPFYHTYETITLDFTGVRNVNSSFANALLVPVFETHGREALKKFRFQNCNPIVRIMIESALTLGLQKSHERATKVAR